AKGVVGLMIGLGISPLAGHLNRSLDLRPLAMVGSLGSLIVLSYRWLQPYLDLTRDEKVRALLVLAAVLSALAVIVFVSSLPNKGASRSPAEGGS
ncbi:MAG TPA: hypothetical protein VM328_10295, partial [Fimbriimonadaceae bacterium]|nr:hypothetical protein [Fimbriimonadaceae bacterium]